MSSLDRTAIRRSRPRPSAPRSRARLRSPAARDHLPRPRARCSASRASPCSAPRSSSATSRGAPSERRSSRPPRRQAARSLRVDVVAPEGELERPRAVAAGKRAAAGGDDGLRPRERLRAQVVRRHRRQGEGRASCSRSSTRPSSTRSSIRRARSCSRPRRRSCSRGRTASSRRRTSSATSSSRPSGVVSQADLDQRKAMAEVDEANVNVAQATIAAQQANMRRLTQLKSFARVTAPFAGTVTQRTDRDGVARHLRQRAADVQGRVDGSRRASSSRSRRTWRPASAPGVPATVSRARVPGAVVRRHGRARGGRARRD